MRPNTQRNSRPNLYAKRNSRPNLYVFFLDYLRGLAEDNGDKYEQMIDHDWEEIIIFSDSWFEKVYNNPKRGGRW